MGDGEWMGKERGDDKLEILEEHLCVSVSSRTHTPPTAQLSEEQDCDAHQQQWQDRDTDRDYACIEGESKGTTRLHLKGNGTIREWMCTFPDRQALTGRRRGYTLV